MMTRLLALGLGSLMIVGCESEPEPEIVVVEPPEKDEVSYDNIDANEGVAEWDVDSDGLLDQEEHANIVKIAWNEWDVDGNARLTEQEFQSGWIDAGFTDPFAAFGDLDVDENAEVLESEWSASSGWAQWDADENGTLELSEFPHY